jgi:tetratricopeptide (TPR) repeat protein
MKNKLVLIFLTLTLLPLTNFFAQEVDIILYLKQIESGSSSDVKAELPELKRKNPDSPSIMFLEGVLTENGQQAIVIYQQIVDKYPDSRYADAALYRIYSYYYALGLYETAKEKLLQLQTKYPSSPYLKVASQTHIPDATEEQQEQQQNIPPEEKKKETVSEQQYKFTIQAGAFSNSDNAKSLLSDFEKSGMFCQIKEKNVAGTVFNVVYVGKFITEDEADNFLKVINEKFKLNARVVPISW